MDKNTEKELLDIVRKNYDEIAQGFSETRGKPLWPEVLKILQIIRSDSYVLDVGCGNGRILKGLEDKNVKYVGVDLSEKLLDIAKQNFPEQKFVKGDILKLGDLAEHDFDYVLSIAVLHHIPGEKLRLQALKQLKNKIKQDGKIILTVWNLWGHKKYRKHIIRYFLLKLFRKNKMDFGDILFEWKKDYNFSRRYYHAFGSFELRRLIGKAGLKIEKFKKDKYNFYFVLTR